MRRKCKKIAAMPRKPIITDWLQLPATQDSLRVIDGKVKYLLQHQGGEKKLNQWLLSDDINFVTLTAERYVIDYLILKNSNMEDNLGEAGPDANLKLGDEDIGIEVTTLNGFIGEWILQERLIWFLSSSGLLHDKTLRIVYDHERIKHETDANTIYQYVEELATAIQAVNAEQLANLNVSVEWEQRWSGQVSWSHNNADSFPWFKYLTDDLLSKLSERRKKKQLKKHRRNVVFVGINHMSPFNWAIPSIFQEMGTGGVSYNIEIQSIEDWWSKIQQDHEEITGICFFCYSLEKVEPFYPLRIIWVNAAGSLPINL